MKFKLKNSVTSKLFILISICLLFVIVLFITFQTAVFKKYYLNTKINNITTNFNNFASDYEKNNWSLEKLLDNSHDFNIKNNTVMQLYSENEFFLFPNEYFQITVEKDGIIQNFNIIGFQKRIIRDNLKYDIPITVDGIIVEDQFLITKLTLNNLRLVSETMDNVEKDFEANVEKFSFDGLLKDFTLINKYSYNQEILNKFILSSKINNFYETKNGLNFKIVTDNANLTSIVAFKKVNNNYLYVLTTFQSANESLKFLSKFYILFFIIIIGILILIAYFIYKMITKPIYKLSKSAKQMAQLDFNNPIYLNRSDEIGQLSNNLNYLACNLEKSLGELKSANQQLKYDIQIERERKQKTKEFIANVSHEFKTPLSVIKGYSEAIKDGIYPVENIDVITDEADNLNKMVFEMLELAKLENNNFKLNKIKFNLSKMIYDLTSRQKSIINKDCDIDIEQNYYLFADKEKMRNVIQNLINNAFKFCDNDGIIKIKLAENLFSIENTFANKDDLNLDNIFDRFFKFNKSRNKNVSKGTGLGLSIVKTTIDLHNFDINVHNTDTGIKFEIHLNNNYN